MWRIQDLMKGGGGGEGGWRGQRHQRGRVAVSRGISRNNKYACMRNAWYYRTILLPFLTFLYVDLL